jgi:nucleoside 2-deoxyribosyltransferase
MIVYIAGKITGDPNYMEKFAAAQKEIEDLGYKVINPAERCKNLPDSFEWDDYMAVTLRLLDHADMLATLPDWKESPGACIEIGFAIASSKMTVGINTLKEWGKAENDTKSKEKE